MQYQSPLVEETMWKYACVYLAKTPEESASTGMCSVSWWLRHWFWSWIAWIYKLIPSKQLAVWCWASWSPLFGPQGPHPEHGRTIVFISWGCYEEWMNYYLLSVHGTLHTVLAITVVMCGQNEWWRAALLSRVSSRLPKYTIRWGREEEWRRVPRSCRGFPGPVGASLSKQPWQGSWHEDVSSPEASFSSWVLEPRKPILVFSIVTTNTGGLNLGQRVPGRAETQVVWCVAWQCCFD